MQNHPLHIKKGYNNIRISMDAANNIPAELLHQF